MEASKDRLSVDKKRLTVVVPIRIKEQLRKAAEADGRSMSNYIANVLEKHFKSSKG